MYETLFSPIDLGGLVLKTRIIFVPTTFGLSREAYEEKIQAVARGGGAMGRQLIADPEWPNKVQSGRAQDIRRCVRCSKDRLGGMKRHEGVHCIYDREAIKA